MPIFPLKKEIGCPAEMRAFWHRHIPRAALFLKMVIIFERIK